MKVAVVGAGPAGLCCARHLTKLKEHFQCQVFEKAKEVGGTWVYTPISSSMDVHSSIYKNLRVNLPKEIMYFPEFPFSSQLPSFPSHREVLKYLQDYASNYELDQVIKCGTKVETIEPIAVDCLDTCSTTVKTRNHSHSHELFVDNVKWKVTVKDVETGKVASDEYDAVFVCNGHFSEPDIPPIPGLSSFAGDMIHSHMYREPEVYSDQSVLVVGGGQSGRDICVDLAKCARQVYWCVRGPKFQFSMPANVEQLPVVCKITERTVYFSNGQQRVVNSIILATGYKYSFPFLTDESGIKIIGGKRVSPLYHHTFNSLHPSMAFIGINFGFNPFPYFDYQVRWALSVWSGHTSLPGISDMLQEENEHYLARLQQGIPPHRASHFLGSHQWEMIDLIASLCNTEPQAPVIQLLYDEVKDRRSKDLVNYREDNYVILSADKWVTR